MAYVIKTDITKLKSIFASQICSPFWELSITKKWMVPKFRYLSYKLFNTAFNMYMALIFFIMALNSHYTWSIVHSLLHQL